MTVRKKARVRTERFTDRLDPQTYEADDDVVGVYEVDPEESDARWFSGSRLFRRLTAIGSAYELHTLPILDGAAAMRLNQAQCQSLLDEVAFIAERVNDALLVEVAQSITDYVSARVRRPGWIGEVTFDVD